MTDVVLAHTGRTVDLRLDGPERIALVGPNGSGRTTMLRTALGELQLLVLDEPTNTLDLASIDHLVDALRAFRGACSW